MTAVSDAATSILERIPQLAAERLPLAAVAGRVLAEEVRAERDQPPFDRVTMDGIAIAYGDWAAGVRRFSVLGTQAAGVAALRLSGAAQCVEVMTGAPLPRGADTVIPVERIQRDGDVAAVSADARVAERQFVHARGSDRKSAEVLLRPGTLLGGPEVAVLASAGRALVSVAALPHAAVISTGDELVDVGEPLADYQIRSSNDYALEASLTRHRLARVTRARLRDDAAALAESIAKLHDETDFLILSGGVSMGQFDFVPAVLERLGATVVFHKIEQRPGRPMWFGTSAAGKPIFALPGNPVSTLVCATRYILPALRQAAGLAPAPQELVTLAAPVEAFGGLTLFMPITLSWSRAGLPLATPRPTNTSGDFATLAATDGFVELPPASAAFPAGTPAPLYRW